MTDVIPPDLMKLNGPRYWNPADPADFVVVQAALRDYLTKHIAELAEASASVNLDYAKDCCETILRVIALLQRR